MFIKYYLKLYNIIILSYKFQVLTTLFLLLSFDRYFHMQIFNTNSNVFLGTLFWVRFLHFLWHHFYGYVFMGAFFMGTFLWARFLHGTIGDTLELSLTRLAEEFVLDHLSGEEDIFFSPG